MPPRVRGPGWTAEERHSLLNTIHRYLPDSPAEWTTVSDVHAEVNTRHRTVSAIKKIFKDYHSPTVPPTGDPNPSPYTIWARQILAEIRERTNGTTGSLHPDDSLQDRGEVIEDLAIDDVLPPAFDANTVFEAEALSALPNPPDNPPHLLAVDVPEELLNAEVARINNFQDRPFIPTPTEEGDLLNAPGPGQANRRPVRRVETADDFPFPPPRVTATPSRNFTNQLAVLGGRGPGGLVVPGMGVSPAAAAGGSGVGDILNLILAQSQIAREERKVEREMKEDADRRRQEAIDRREAKERTDARERMDRADARAEMERAEAKEANQRAYERAEVDRAEAREASQRADARATQFMQVMMMQLVSNSGVRGSEVAQITGPDGMDNDVVGSPVRKSARLSPKK